MCPGHCSRFHPFVQLPREHILRPPDSVGDLYLNGLTTLSGEAAKSLGKSGPGGYKGLSLSGLTSLSDAAAEGLSKHKKRGDLRFNGLTSLSDAAAESLSKHKGQLHLEGKGKIKMSDTAAESLSKHKGELHLNLAKLPASAAKVLRKLRPEPGPYRRW